MARVWTEAEIKCVGDQQQITGSVGNALADGVVFGGCLASAEPTLRDLLNDLESLVRRIKGKIG